ncbi:Uncharacterised protein [Vibrio cholerae]|nr:Uncharacterised protein [Vibrio cholerae]
MRAIQFCDNLRFFLFKRFCNRSKLSCEICICRLFSQCLRPVSRQIEMATTVVNFTDTA